MAFLSNLFSRKVAPRDHLRPLYDAIIALGRDPKWYRNGVPDTIDGRFEVITAILAHVLLRLEQDADARATSAYLTEVFIDDMDAQLRQSGVGDLMVGKHIGTMMGALGGRLGAYRLATNAAERSAALERNLGMPGDGSLDRAGEDLHQLALSLAQAPVAAILAGQLPRVA
ncbi:MAG: ubiquinol-cytochrome C chaperone family protein [Sphingopyxis sp.]